MGVGGVAHRGQLLFGSRASQQDETGGAKTGGVYIVGETAERKDHWDGLIRGK